MALEINHTSFGKLSETADTLIVELSNSAISFCEFELAQNKPLYSCSYPINTILNHSLNEHLIDAIKHFHLSKKTYQHVYINYFNQQFTLCPDLLYNSENNRSLLEFNTGTTSNDLILVDDINHDIKLIYSIDESLKSTLDLIFPNHQLKHTLTVTSKLMLLSEELLKDDIILSLHLNYIEIVLKQNHKLQLANQFSVNTTEDVLYYLLFIIEQYQLNPLTANITIIGNMDSNSDLIVSLKKYIKNIRLGIGNKSINWSGITGAPQHFNYTLLNRLFCE